MSHLSTVRDGVIHINGVDHPVIHINKKQALKLVSEVVKKCGSGAENQGCTYSLHLEPTPNCAVGQALFIAGVPAEQLVEMDRQDYLSVEHGYEYHNDGSFGFTLTRGAAGVLSEFQGAADYGFSFGEAARSARKV